MAAAFAGTWAAIASWISQIYIVKTQTVAGERTMNRFGGRHQQPLGMVVNRCYLVIDQSRR
jgi:hypothetical protein